MDRTIPTSVSKAVSLSPSWKSAGLEEGTTDLPRGHCLSFESPQKQFLLMAAGCPERDDAPWAGGEGTRGSHALQLKEELVTECCRTASAGPFRDRHWALIPVTTIS